MVIKSVLGLESHFKKIFLKEKSCSLLLQSRGVALPASSAFDLADGPLAVSERDLIVCIVQIE